MDGAFNLREAKYINKFVFFQKIVPRRKPWESMVGTCPGKRSILFLIFSFRPGVPAAANSVTGFVRNVSARSSLSKSKSARCAAVRQSAA